MWVDCTPPTPEQIEAQKNALFFFMFIEPIIIVALGWAVVLFVEWWDKRHPDK